MSLKKGVIFSGLFWLFFTVVHFFHMDGVHIIELTQADSRYEWWLRVGRDVSLFLWLGLSVVWSFSSYPDSRHKKWTMPALVVMPFMLLSASVGCFSGAKMISEVYPPDDSGRLTREELMRDVEKELRSDKMSDERKIKLSELAASIIYAETGDIIGVLSESSEMVPFTPSPDDLKAREDTLRVKEMIDHSQMMLKGAGFFWLALLGFYFLTAVYYIRKGHFKREIAQ